MTGDPDTARLKRLKIRAWRRGIKEMDLILGRYVDDTAAAMDATALDRLEALMEESDIDLYAWVTGREPAPGPYADLVRDIAGHAGSTSSGAV